MRDERNPTIIIATHEDNPATRDETEFFFIMQRCFDKFVERNRERHGVWRRSGLRGMTHEVFAKAERAYMDVFIAEIVPDEDHFEDVINYAIFALILLNAWEKAGSERASEQELFKKMMYGEWPRRR